MIAVEVTNTGGVASFAAIIAIAIVAAIVLAVIEHRAERPRKG